MASYMEGNNLLYTLMEPQPRGKAVLTHYISAPARADSVAL